MVDTATICDECEGLYRAWLDGENVPAACPQHWALTSRPSYLRRLWRRLTIRLGPADT